MRQVLTWLANARTMRRGFCCRKGSKQEPLREACCRELTLQPSGRPDPNCERSYYALDWISATARFSLFGAPASAPTTRRAFFAKGVQSPEDLRRHAVTFDAHGQVKQIYSIRKGGGMRRISGVMSNIEFMIFVLYSNIGHFFYSKERITSSKRGNILWHAFCRHATVRIIIAPKMEKTQNAKKRCAGALRSIGSVSLKGRQQ